MQVVERTAGHYEAQHVELGTVFTWVPGNALIKCECGLLFTAESSMVACPKCGADYREVVGGLRDKLLTEEEAYYPIHQEYKAWMKQEEESHHKHPERLYSWGLFSGLAAKDELKQILDVLYGT